MHFDSLPDVLTFAIRKERDARDLYLMFRDMVKDPGAKQLLKELADQEMGHQNMLENALKEKQVAQIGGKQPVDTLQISDHLISGELEQDSSPQDVMIFAMKAEEASRALYAALRSNYEGTDLESIFEKLAHEELRHKQILEREYEEHFMQWM